VTSQQPGRWMPLPLDELRHLLAPAPFPWWVAGGHALDLFLGHTTRPHGDLDLEVLRPDQHAAQRLLAGWDLHVAAGGRLRPWRDGEWLAPDDNSIWCRAAPGAPWCLQLLLADSDNGNWVFRRNPAIVQPLEAIGRRTAGGMPYLAPAVQLLFKAKNPRPKDIVDFNAVLPELPGGDRAWLASALAATHPGHPWLAQLLGESNL